MGLKLSGSEWSLPGLGMGVTTALPDSQMWLYTFRRPDKAESGRWLKIDRVHGPNQWPSHWLFAMTVSIW